MTINTGFHVQTLVEKIPLSSYLFFVFVLVLFEFFLFLPDVLHNSLPPFNIALKKPADSF